MQRTDNAKPDQECDVGYIRRLFESISAAVDDPLLVFDRDWRLIHLNPAAETVFAPQVKGSLLRAFVPEDLIALIETRPPFGEWTYNERVFVPHVKSISDGEENADGWIVTLRDVTEFKRLSHNQREFVRVASHDLRSPLTSIQGFAGMLQQQLVGDLNEKQAQFVAKILSGITQITKLVDNIQDAGRFDVQSGFYEMQRALCDVRDIVHRVVSSHRDAAETKRLQIDVELADDVSIVYADSIMLERAFGNLVDNAVKYTPEGGSITVSTYRMDGRVVLSVNDTGEGISADEQAQLFQRHVRLARKEHRKVRGSGLGLFIVRNVALRHDGNAWVESVEGEGSTFSFSIAVTPDTQSG